MKGLKVTGQGMDKIMADLAKLSKTDVLVGFPEGAPRADAEGQTNAQLAYVHDNGAPERNIPARPFMQPAMDDCKEALGNKAGQMLNAINQGRDVVDQGLHQIGLIASTAIKEKINSNIPPELSDRTLEERQARGVTRTNTLVDTGAMRNAATYVIRNK